MGRLEQLCAMLQKWSTQKMSAHFYTINAVEKANVIQNLGFRDEGTACWVYGSGVSGPTPLFRARHPSSNSHLYTMSSSEIDNAVYNLGYVSEGIAGFIYDSPDGSRRPLYRAFLGSLDDHFYTSDAQELARAVSNLGYQNEGIVGYVLKQESRETRPLHRLWLSTHFYTSAEAERQNVINQGYTDEGVVGYVFPTPIPGPAPLFRAFHPPTLTHFYTTSVSELNDTVANSGYISEGISCYISLQPSDNLVAKLYRAYSSDSNDHFYTTDEAELQNAVQHLGFSNEGPIGYVSSSQGLNLTPLFRLFGPMPVVARTKVPDPIEVMFGPVYDDPMEATKYYMGSHPYVINQEGGGFDFGGPNARITDVQNPNSFPVFVAHGLGKTIKDSISLDHGAKTDAFRGDSVTESNWYAWGPTAHAHNGEYYGFELKVFWTSSS
jgi:hypothetical protein